MGALSFFARLGDLVPSTPKPARRPDLKYRLLFTLVAVMLYYSMTSVTVYPVSTAAAGPQLPPLMQVVFAATTGTLAQLGIGPIVTAGLIIQVLVGGKLIELDLTNPDDRKLFTQAEKGLALVIAAVEAAGFALTYRMNLFVTISIALQFFLGALILIMLDEAIQKGYGIGSGISLFILAGVAKTIVWDIFAPVTVPVHSLDGSVRNYRYGVIPYVVGELMRGEVDFNRLLYGYVPGQLASGEVAILPSLTGMIATFMFLVIVIYLQGMKINIPVTIQRAPGIRGKVPLNFLYVSNIPVLLVGIVISDILLVRNMVEAYIPQATWFKDVLDGVLAYLTPPRGLLGVIYDPIRSIVYAAVLVGLAVLFGLMWVEVGGLSPANQAENLIKSGISIPGMRANPKALELILAKYVYPLAILSSIIVASLAIVADVFSVYGGGIGLLLAAGILQQLYTALTYEQALEMYPVLRRLVGE
ncbi:MAG: preprotein translocase subunit SecY [Sulfolobales archaeon]|nr:preprotein translocase subunit SecY [Sulfolobales archaeon]MDW8083183.1 preprotein translocase subunit SecY [Sulfolobales archaeon]